MSSVMACSKTCKVVLTTLRMSALAWLQHSLQGSQPDVDEAAAGVRSLWGRWRVPRYRGRSTFDC